MTTLAIPPVLPLDGNGWIDDGNPAIPSPVATDFERDVEHGRRTLTGEQLKEFAGAVLRLRALAAWEISLLPNWLAGKPAAEIQRRLNTWLMGRFQWFAEVMEGLQDRQDGVSRDDWGNVVKRRKAAKRR